MQDHLSMHIIRSDGETFDLGGDSEWLVDMGASSGWTTVKPTVATEANVLTDGDLVVNKRVESSDRTLRAVYYGTDRAKAHKYAVAFFNPRHSFEVHVNYLGRKRWCAGEQVRSDVNFRPSDTHVILTWSILCPIPYMQDEDRNESEFGSSIPSFGFPYVSHTREILPNGEQYPVGSVVSRLIYDGINTIYNTGDAPTFYQVVMTAKGFIRNPRFEKDDKHITINTTIDDGDVLIVDFEASPPTVTLNGENIINRCSRDSNFTGMRMQVGKNRFYVTMDNTENRSLLEVQVLHNKKYLGV